MILLLLPLLSSLASSAEWRLVREERFTSDPNVQAAPWVEDTHGETSPWEAGPLDDDGAFFHESGGGAFAAQLASFQLLRKRVRFGQDGWLTAELAARGKDALPRLTPLKGGVRLEVPRHDGGLIIRSSSPLPERCRVEVKIKNLDFGPIKRSAPKTIHPWTWGPGPVQAQPYAEWPPADEVNGFYYLAIVDYDNPAPHNNVFIHTRRKAVMDSYNGAPSPVCDPRTGRSVLSSEYGLNMLFPFRGQPLEDFLESHSPCGVSLWEKKPGQTTVAADRLDPKQPYSFAIERDGDIYTLEAAGRFVYGGERVFRSSRRVERRSGTDYFILGDPHVNYYEGTAVIESIRLYE